MVTVPKLRWKPEAKVVGITMLECKTDPLLLAIKSAINWMSQNGEKPLPAGEERSYSSEEERSNSSEEDDLDDCTIPDFIQFKAPVVTP